jgi:hypothetical protein
MALRVGTVVTMLTRVLLRLGVSGPWPSLRTSESAARLDVVEIHARSVSHLLPSGNPFATTGTAGQADRVARGP